MPNEIGQAEKDKNCMSSLVCGIQKTTKKNPQQNKTKIQTHRKRDWISGYSRWGELGRELEENSQKVETSS